MKILVTGSGGREDALLWKLRNEGHTVYGAPGNAGTARYGTRLPELGVGKDKFGQVADFVAKEGIDMVIPGPEAPLGDGFVDFMQARGYKNVFGPTQAAADLELDKFFSYDVMLDAGVPQANSIKCCNLEEAHRAIDALANPLGVVAKAPGSHAGKGVKVFDSAAEAHAGIEQRMKEYGERTLMAERMEGPEMSVFAICDGLNALPFKVAFQDHKRALDGDRGDNTGGMGAYGPVSFVDAALMQQIQDTILQPTMEEMYARGKEFTGFMYAGLMLTPQGPKVVEFNCRMGDPEVQPALMLMASELAPVLQASLEGVLLGQNIAFKQGAAVALALTAPGYPGSYKKGIAISETAIRAAESRYGGIVFQATTERDGDNVTNQGGRMLYPTVHSEAGLADAIERVNGMRSVIDPDGKLYARKDIGLKGLQPA